MTELSAQMKPHAMDMHGHSPGVVLRSLVIGLTAFLTLVDLFATQAILPVLARTYHVTPRDRRRRQRQTIGMAIAGLWSAFSARISTGGSAFWSAWCCSRPHHAARRRTRPHDLHDPAGASGPLHGVGFYAHAGLSGRAMQLADAGGAFAAYITGNVASNLIGRLIRRRWSTLRAGSEFLFFALLNLAGAVLVYFTIRRVQPMPADARAQSPFAAWSPICAIRGCGRPSPSASASCSPSSAPLPSSISYWCVRRCRSGDGPRLRLFRVPAFRRHHAVCRQGRGPIRHPAGVWGALAVAASACRCCCLRICRMC